MYPYEGMILVNPTLHAADPEGQPCPFSNRQAGLSRLSGRSGWPDHYMTMVYEDCVQPVRLICSGNKRRMTA